MYRMLAAIAEFQRGLIVANTREGLAAAWARGRKGGRKPKLNAAQVQLAQQLYAIFTVPRTTIYGHLTNGTAGARPRARRLAATEPAEATSSPAASLRPKPARIPLTDEPPSAQEIQRRQRLIRQREAMRAARCPTCGNEPIDAQTRWRQRQDLTTTWLHLDGDELREQRHCVACQPHQQILLIECDRCGDGPWSRSHRRPRPRAVARSAHTLAEQQRVARAPHTPLREPSLTVTRRSRSFSAPTGVPLLLNPGPGGSPGW
jgi:hypothetical protein